MPGSPLQNFLGIVLPGILIGIATLLFWRPWNRSLSNDPRWVFGPLVAGCFCLGFWNLEHRPVFPPGGNVVDWLFYFPIFLALLAFLDALLLPPLWLRVILLVILFRIAAGLLLLPLVPGSLTAGSSGIWIDVAGLVAAVWFLCLETLAEKSPGVAAPAVLALLTIGCAILLAMGWHIQGSGTLAGALAATCIAALPAAFWNSRISLTRGFAGCVAILLPMLLLHGYFYTNDTLTVAQEIWAILLIAAPLLAFLPDIPFLHRHLGPKARTAIRLVAVGLVIVVVAEFTIRDYARAEAASQAGGNQMDE